MISNDGVATFRRDQYATHVPMMVIREQQTAESPDWLAWCLSKT